MATVLSYHNRQDIRPPSPALTNPDMILPYGTEENYVAPERGAELTPPQTSRPNLPGAWFSEEDIHPGQLQAIPGNNALKPETKNMPMKSPVARFLNTVNPSMRQGIGVEIPEYSPSVYSPVSSHPVSPEGQDGIQSRMFGSSPSDAKQTYDDDDDDFMGSRAEEILANAKQRLLAMENNLNRARTLSLGTTTDPTPIEQTRTSGRLQKTSSANHLRMSSDSMTNGKTAHDPYVRSASALGSPSPFSSFVHQHHHLEPLDEDELLGSPFSEMDASKTSMKDLQDQMTILKGKVNTLKQKSREDSLRRRSLQALKAPSPFTNADIGISSPYLPHMRPASNSSDRSEEFLGDHAKVVKNFDYDSPEDSPLVKFKRDEPSPAGETFFEDESEIDGETDGRVGDHRSMVVAPSKDPDLPTPASQTVVFDHVEDEIATPHSQTAIFDHVDSEDPDPVSRSSSPEPEAIIPSSPTYEGDLMSRRVSILHMETGPAHEDRPDAFDYETYVLNSTMGSFSRNGFRSRSGSISSTGSASTQRPIHNAYDGSPQPASATFPARIPHQRNDSLDSMSSTATFATAITGRNDSRAASRAKGRGVNGLLSPQIPTSSSYTNLRQAVNNLAVPPASGRRNSFSPLASPSSGSFPLPDDSSLSASEARQQILALLLRSSPPTTGESSSKDELGRCWAPEDAHLIGSVIDGLVKVVGRIVTGDDQGDAGRSVLESIGAVLQRS